MESKTLIMMVGLPRSGKSTYVQKNFRGITAISADQLRKLIYGQEFFEGGEQLVWATRDVMLRALMEQGLPVVIDETNTTIKRRELIVKLAKKYGYNITAVWVNTPVLACLDRTDNKALKDTIARMNAQFEVPYVSEGFREVIRIDMYD
jgi:predicted kinase